MTTADRPARAAQVSLARLAWRNVWRHRRRTVLLIVVVAYATFGTIFFWGLIDGFFDSILNGQARFLNAPVVVSTQAFRDDPDPENALPDLSLLEPLLRQPAVRAASVRLEFPALLRSAYAAEPVQARGIDPALESAVSSIPARIGQGRMLGDRGEIVLGRTLASRIDARVGERVVLDAASAAGPQAAGLVVVGLVESSVPLVDQTTVLVHLDDARRLTGVRTATTIALDVPRGREDAVARALEPQLPSGVRAYGLSELLGVLQKDMVAHRIAMIPIGLIFSSVAAVAVTSTVLVSVIERTRELGMISALGLTPARLARMVMLEATFTTVVGWIVGLIAGYGTVLWLGQVNVIGRLIGTTYSEAFASFGMAAEIYTSAKAVYALYASATVALAAVLAVLIPSRRVRRLDPARAMRVE